MSNATPDARYLVFLDIYFSFTSVGTWEPEIKRWYLLYRPDDIYKMHNTNNGTEGLNESLE